MSHVELEPVLSPDSHQDDNRYPDIQFDVSRLHLFQAETEIFEINDDTRLARTLTSLSGTCPQIDISAEERNRLLTARKNYLNSKTTINGAERSRKSLLDTDLAYRDATRLLKCHNHPAVQLTEQIDKVHNADREHDAEMRRLQENIVTVIAWKQLRAIFEDQLKEVRTSQTADIIGIVEVEETTHPDTPAA